MAVVNSEIRFAPQLTTWFAANPTKVLQDGEIVYCKDGANAGKYVIGDNSTQLSALTFYGGISASGLTVGTTTITGGTSTRVLYNNAGVVGEYAVTGTGTTAVLSTSPVFSTDITTPKVLTDGTQVVYLPNQTNYVGSLFIGNGGASINNTGVDAGDYNTYIGIDSGLSTTISKKNTAIGTNTLRSTTSGWANTAIGYNTLSTGVGTGSLTISGNGTEFYANTGVGESVMPSATTGSYNTGVGVNALFSLTTGIFNVGMGVHALQSITTQNRNTAIGKEALYNYADDNGTALGFSAAWSKTTGAVLAIGYQAGYSDISTGANIFIGHQAGYYQKSGYYQTIIGFQAGYASLNKNGYYHTIIGYRAGFQLGSCEGNTHIGYQSGYSKTTGDYNTFIGHDAGNNASQLATAGNSTAIGYGSYTTKSNQIVFGNASITETKFTAGSVICGSAAIATTATGGFLYVPSCAGTPTGVPVAQTGTIPVVVDSANNKMYIYSGGAWVALN